MSVRDTSAEAHKEIGDAIADKVKALFLREGGIFTRREIATLIGALPGSIPSAVSKLIDKGFLLESHKVKCTVSGRQVYGVTRDNAKLEEWRASGDKAAEVLAHV